MDFLNYKKHQPLEIVKNLRTGPVKILKGFLYSQAACT